MSSLDVEAVPSNLRVALGHYNETHSHNNTARHANLVRAQIHQTKRDRVSDYAVEELRVDVSTHVSTLAASRTYRW